MSAVGQDRLGEAPAAIAPREEASAAPDRAGAAIEVEGLVRRYGERAALGGVTFGLEAGRSLAVLGPNGAGKTTLLRVLAGLLRPHAGAVSVAGAELPRESWKVRGRVGYLGHDPLLYRELSARENLRFHADLHGVDRGRVDEFLSSSPCGKATTRRIWHL